MNPIYSQLAADAARVAALARDVSEVMAELGLDAPGRPIVFGTTEEFLRNFGVDSTDNLPEISPVKMEDFRAEVEEEMQIKLDV